jgi:hypothetical protein
MRYGDTHMCKVYVSPFMSNARTRTKKRTSLTTVGLRNNSFIQHQTVPRLHHTHKNAQTRDINIPCMSPNKNMQQIPSLQADSSQPRHEIHDLMTSESTASINKEPAYPEPS